MSEKYIASLDVGTTTVRCLIYNSKSQILANASDKVRSVGCCEIDEEEIFQQCVYVIRRAIEISGLTASDISCLGIATQRNTFITWDKDTGKPFHHLMTWKDMRAASYVRDWNKSYVMMFIRSASRLLYSVTGSLRHLAVSLLQFKNTHVCMRLKWMLDNNKELKKRASMKKVSFGTLDTWLVWKLTNARCYATDFSNASSTALFDPYVLSWSSSICMLLGIPMHILPPIFDTCDDYGYCDEKFFGYKLPIRSLVGDQQASMFGQCCFEKGNMKCTMGLGTFVDVKMGGQPMVSNQELFPIVGWKIKDEVVYLMEGYSSDTCQPISWLQSCGQLMSELLIG
ncbi:hypothetical protein HELRODRAFT_84542 [Helobdella robusta]|uniref:Carbohydrate kinase FGGY N-terminal domain-containing protein n=1 Tax=Helobdella robusta TaxID=6412 RepID=T1G5K1_HELRO|nr:hypothetical protein HELRODRAFT_84542 [Helobdella robusta]ESN98389.1 hypothetical protein HELRODRAFT_84542 [Helobdella robusta]